MRQMPVEANPETKHSSFGRDYKQGLYSTPLGQWNSRTFKATSNTFQGPFADTLEMPKLNYRLAWPEVPGLGNVYSYMSEGPDYFQSALVTTTTACWLAGNRLRYFLTAILSLRGKLGCAVWKLLEVALDKLSLLTASHHYRFHDDFQSSQLSMLKQHLCWLPVITIVPMMTASHHYCSHDDFQSSLLFPWWLPVITIVTMNGMITFSHHNCNSPCWSNACADCQLSLLFPWWLQCRHHYCSHDNFQSSQINVLSPRWSNICADCQSSLSFPWWRPLVITTNAVGGISHGHVQSQLISVEWLAARSFSSLFKLLAGGN